MSFIVKSVVRAHKARQMSLYPDIGLRSHCARCEEPLEMNCTSHLSVFVIARAGWKSLVLRRRWFWWPIRVERHINGRPYEGPSGAPSSADRPTFLSGGCEQLPVPWHNDRVDDVDDAIRCSDIALSHMRTVHLHIRTRHHGRQRTSLNGHHIARF